MDIFVKQLRKAMSLKGWRQVDLKNALGESDGQISSWYNGRYRPNAEAMARIANVLGVSVDYLLGKEEPPAADPPKTHEVPVLGKVAAGVPISAQVDIIGTVYTEKDGELYALRIKGDSMSPRIMDGDTVLVHPQTIAEDGDLVIVMIGDDVTCKVLKQNTFGVTLVPFNAAYAPFVFTAAQVDDLHIIGKVVESRHEWN